MLTRCIGQRPAPTTFPTIGAGIAMNLKHPLEEDLRLLAVTTIAVRALRIVPRICSVPAAVLLGVVAHLSNIARELRHPVDTEVPRLGRSMTNEADLLTAMAAGARLVNDIATSKA